MQSYNLINGNIITLNNHYPIVESITISHGKIEGINSPNAKYESKDLLGATVIPGFIDAHFHLKNFGKRLSILNLKGIDSIDSIKNKIQKKLKNLNPGSWLLGFGWDQNLWVEKTYPTQDITNIPAVQKTPFDCFVSTIA